jgi:hypothetical protein
MIDWEEIEKACMSLDKDCVPQNATENERQELVDKHMCLGRGFKKSLFECYVDLTDKEKKIFRGVDWNAVNLVKLTWTAANIYLYDLNLKSLPPCPRYVIGDFYCSSNSLTSLKGAPRYVFGAFHCHNNSLTSLEGAPERVGGSFFGGSLFCGGNKLASLEGAPERVGGGFHCDNNYLTSLVGAPERVGGGFHCGNNKLPETIPARFPGSDLHKYVGLKESFVMRWNEFNK